MYKHIRACDLIVMASHGRRGLTQLLLGSQARNVVAHSSNPRPDLPLTHGAGDVRLSRSKRPGRFWSRDTGERSAAAVRRFA